MDDFHPDNPNANEIYSFLIKYLSPQQIIMIAAIKSGDILNSKKGVCGMAISDLDGQLEILELRNKLLKEKFDALLKSNPWADLK